MNNLLSYACLRRIDEIARSPALVVAPHPDDETLGCGGAIALLRSLGCDVRVLVISDGTLSHPNSKKYPGESLRKLREQETLTALNLLSVNAEAVTFLRLKDGSVSLQYLSAIANCRAYLAEIAPQIIFLPWRYDPHPDHRASWKLIQTAFADPSAKLIEYPIWDWDPQQQGKGELQEQNSSASQSVITWRLDISAVVELKQQAIALYRSQTTNLIDDDPDGFRLTPEMLLNFFRPWEVFLEVPQSKNLKSYESHTAQFSTTKLL